MSHENLLLINNFQRLMPLQYTLPSNQMRRFFCHRYLLETLSQRVFHHLFCTDLVCHLHHLVLYRYEQSICDSSEEESLRSRSLLNQVCNDLLLHLLSRSVHLRFYNQRSYSLLLEIFVHLILQQLLQYPFE